MSKFEFESHENTPDDQYVKEVVTFKFTYENDCFYVPYFRKQAKDGGLFWSTASVGVTYQGSKKYFDSFVLDSRMREKQIKEFLELRKWENNALPKTQQAQQIIYPHGLAQPKPTSMSEVVADDTIPF